MSYFWPRTKREAAASAWPVVFFVVGPLVAFVVLFWNLYFTSDALLWTFLTSISVAIPFTAILVRRASHMARLGIHPWFRAGHRFGLRQRFVLWLALSCFLHFFGLALLGLHLLVAGQPSSLDATVKGARPCAIRCLGCSHIATVRSSLMEADICVDRLESRPVPGSKVILRGRSTGLAHFVSYVQQ